MAPHHEEDDNSDVNGQSKQPVWTGLSAIAGLFGFFLVEQFVALYGRIKRQRQQVKRTKADASAELGRLSTEHRRRSHDHGDVLPIGSNQNYLELRQPLKGSSEGNTEHEEEHNHNKPFHKEDPAHGHGHSHSVPTSVSSAAWMVIMGDGLHNFTDGLAIGASFASSLAVGLSTSLAVFCHELPHELGDFAVLLKSGMSVRQALAYNIVSSFLCLLGMVIGVLVGHVESATSWIFTVTAGIFIYIALVDMLPEMTSTLAHAGDSGAQKQLQYLLLHSFGIATGVGVMLLIALFEESIQLSIDGSP